jgi:hypothetical protein
MDEPTKPDNDWRKQIAAATEQLSALDLKFDFGKLYVQSMEPLWDSIRESSAALHNAVADSLPHDFLKTWTAEQAAVATALQAELNSPAYQYLSKHLSDCQTTGLQAAFKAAEYEPLFAQIAAHCQSNALLDSWAKLSKVVAESMKATFDALDRVELLAALGWMIPMEMSLPEFHNLVRQRVLTPEAVEEWFLEYYSRDEGAEFDILKDHLLESGHLVFWKLLLEQVLDSFSRGHFAVCVPSLLSVLEGSIAVPWGVSSFHNNGGRKKFFDQQISASNPDSIRQLQWKSLAAFVNAVFDGGNPNREYSIPKRNLILHGKSDPAKWDRADCLRLFQAIDAILSLGCEVGKSVGIPTAKGIVR